MCTPERAHSFWGVRTPRLAAQCAVTALLDPMVGEACVHVQGESLKTYAALLTEASQPPDHQGGEAKRRHVSSRHLIRIWQITEDQLNGRRADIRCGAPQVSAGP
jgi:hypothetical protein